MEVAYYNRYNTRITYEGNTEPGGIPGLTGAISTVLTSNLTASRVVVSNASGKLEASPITVTKVNYLTDVTSNIQAQLDGKEPTLTKGNLTESTSSVLTITGGTGAIIGSGLTIRVLEAGAGQSGYISSTDWNTFNNKLSTTLTSARIFVGNGSNVATGVAMSGVLAITNAGVTSFTAGAIMNADVNASAAIAYSKLAALTASRVLGSDGSGFVTALDTATYPSLTELSYVKGVTSALQTQLGTKLTVNITGEAQGDLILRNASEFVNLPIGTSGYVLTSDGTTAAWSAPLANGIPTGGTADQYLSKIDGTNYNTQWTTLTVSKLTDFSGTANDLDILAGADAAGLTSSEIQYLIGATSNIQTQIGTKLTNSLAQNAMWIGSPSNQASSLAPGTDGYVLTMAAGVPTWQAVVGTGTVTSVDVDGGSTGLTFSGGPVTTTGTITMAGTLDANNGGTGLSSYTIGDILQASSSSALSALASVATGNVLISGGVGTVSSWGKVTSSHINSTVTDLFWKTTGATAITGASTISGNFAITWESNAGSYPYRFATTTSTNYVGFNPGTTSSIAFGNPSGTAVIGIQSGAANLIWVNKKLNVTHQVKFTNITTEDTNCPTIGRNADTSSSGSMILSVQSGNNVIITGQAAFTFSGGPTFSVNGGSTIWQTLVPAIDTGSGLTNLTFTGIKYDPTISGTSGLLNHYAIVTSAGKHGFGTLTPTAHFEIVQPVNTSGSLSAFLLTAGAHTTLAASTEATDVRYDLSRTVQFATGALALQRAFRIEAPTYAFVGASTITDAYTVYIDGSPIAGTNASITNSFALGVGGSFEVLTSTSTARFGTTSARITGFSTAITGTVTLDGDTGLVARTANGAFLFETATGLHVKNVTSPPGAATSDAINIYSKDSSDGSSNSTLALYLEQAVEATGTFTQTHRLKIWVNNVEYWISLDAV